MGLHFTKEEFSKRKSKVIQIMKEQKIDALLMFRQKKTIFLLKKTKKKLMKY